MGRASDTLIPARFLLTVGHFIVVVLAFYHRVRPVDASQPTQRPRLAAASARLLRPTAVRTRPHPAPVQEAHVAAGLGTDPSASDVTKAGNSLLAALGLSIICLALCLWGLMAGFTLFFDRLNTIHMVLHFFGGVLTAWYIVDVWGYLSYW